MSVNLSELVKKAGVVGAGGAGFPTHVKFVAKKIDTFIVNGAECEPLLRLDQQLMVHFTDKMIRGLQLGMQATGATQGIIGIKKKHSKAIKIVERAIASDNRLKIHLLDDFYPAGDEFVLVYEATQRIIPEAGLPLMVGVVVNNVGTLINVADAYDGKPVVSKFVTITGAVNNPKTINVPIGTSFAELIEHAGGTTIDNYKIISGGPMMGSVIVKPPEQEVVTKTSSGIIVLPKDHYLIRMKTQETSAKVVVTKAACIRCQLCTEVCPRYLLGHELTPDKVMRAIAFGGKPNNEHLTNAFLCVQCGACTYYGCPMGLDPCKMMKEVTQQLRTEGLENTHRKLTVKTHIERELRKLPVKRLIARLNLIDYDVSAPMELESKQTKIVRIPLKQHIGSPAIPTVEIGDEVKVGDLIGKIPDGMLGANIHASISGVIEEVTNEIIIKKR